MTHSTPSPQSTEAPSEQEAYLQQAEASLREMRPTTMAEKLALSEAIARLRSHTQASDAVFVEGPRLIEARKAVQKLDEWDGNRSNTLSILAMVVIELGNTPEGNALLGRAMERVRNKPRNGDTVLRAIVEQADALIQKPSAPTTRVRPGP